MTMSNPIDENMKKMYAAVTEGDCKAVRRLLSKHPKLLNRYAINRTWLHHAAQNGNDDVEMVKTLIDAGIDVNASQEKLVDGPLNTALSFGNAKVARYLLEHGADPNQGRTLIAAANAGSVELVSLLLDYGADLHTCHPNELTGGTPMNALGQAILYGHKDLEKFLREKGAVEPDVSAATAPSTLREQILEHMSQHLGPVEPLALREIVPGDPSIDIHVIHPFDNEDCITLLTTGMSDRAMTVPDGEEEYQYAELKINLPRDWPLSSRALKNPKHRWPIEWLRKIAYYPHENGTWLGGASTIISNDEPPKPFAPNTKLSCMLLLTDETETGRIELPDGKVITVYSLYPIYTEERDLERAEGVVRLVELLEQHAVRSWVDIKRVNVAMPKKRTRR
jgi:hypothetical protein